MNVLSKSRGVHFLNVLVVKRSTGTEIIPVFQLDNLEQEDSLTCHADLQALIKEGCLTL